MIVARRIVFLLLWLIVAGAAHAAPIGGMAQTWPSPSSGLPAGCVPGGNCLQNIRTGTVYLGLATDYIGGVCFSGTVPGACAGTPFANAVNDPATLPGDTINVYPSTYTEGDVNVEISLTFTCIGVAPSRSGPGDCIRDSAASYRPGTTAFTKQPGTPAGNGLVTFGEFRIGGNSAARPTVVVNGIQFQNATSTAVPITHAAENCFGVTIAPGAPKQCGGTASGGVRIQSGDFTCNDCGMFNNVNGIISQPFIFGTNTVICNRCFFQNNGGGDGQEHSWYCGRQYQCQLNNSIVLDTLSGHGFKNRGFASSATGDIIGDSDACGITTWVGAGSVGGTPALQQAFRPAAINSGAGWGMANEINNPDGGAFVGTNNTLCKSALYSSNAAVGDQGGVVAPWPGGSWTDTGTILLRTSSAGSGQYLFNPAGASVSSTGLAITGNAPKFGVEGPGVLITPTLNGAPWGGGTSIDWIPITQVVGGAAPLDFRAIPGPHTVTTVRNGAAILGGAGRLTVTLATGNGGQVTPGTGGADVTIGAKAENFIDAAGDAASTVTMPNEPTAAFFNADGDAVNITGAGGSYMGGSARNMDLRLCNGGTLAIGVSVPSISCGTFEFKSSFGYVASGTVTFQGASDTVFCDNGCNIFMQGSDNPAGFEFYASPSPGVSPGPATVMMDTTLWKATNSLLSASEHVQYNATGCAWIGGYNDIEDFTNPICRNFFFLIDFPNPLGIGINNSTVDPGPSVTHGGGQGDTITGPTLTPTIIAGSGTFTYTLGAGPTLIEVLPTSMTGIHGGYVGDIMPAHLSGGTLSVGQYNSANAPNVPIMLLGGLTSTCAAAGGTDTLTVSDGTTVKLTSAVACGSVNFTPPAGSQAGSLSASSASGTHGTTISIPVTWTDAWFQGYSGEGFVRVCAATGKMVFNGMTGSAAGCVTAAGRYQDMAPALAALQETLGAAGSDTVTVDTWNPGAQHLTSTISVTVH